MKEYICVSTTNSDESNYLSKSYILIDSESQIEYINKDIDTEQDVKEDLKKQGYDISDIAFFEL